MTKENNFDLIRLIAALQVLFFHFIIHYMLIEKDGFLWNILNQFPGVPIFFFISGYLITASLARNSNNLKQYFRNRFFRIYPALWFCLLVTILLMSIKGLIQLDTIIFWQWFLAQATFMQAYSPIWFEGYGMGHTNGSLWSVVVEVQYYLALPAVFWVLTKAKTLKKQNLLLILLIFASYCIGVLLDLQTKKTSLLPLPFVQALQSTFQFKVLKTSVLWYFYFFGIGMLFYFNRLRLLKFVAGKFWFWLAIYIAYFSVAVLYFKAYYNPHYFNFYSAIAILILAMLVFSAAYTNIGLSKKLLKGNDFSYGIYIYHMPVINFVVATWHTHHLSKYPMMLISSIFIAILAMFSWYKIEKPALKYK
jgi:peptidoglycan/LPS O-acetylase OafA/YrhL